MLPDVCRVLVQLPWLARRGGAISALNAGSQPIARRKRAGGLRKKGFLINPLKFNKFISARHGINFAFLLF